MHFKKRRDAEFKTYQSYSCCNWPVASFFTLSMICFLMLLSLFGCNQYLNDSDKTKKPFEVSFQGGECISQIPEVLSNYFLQNLKADKLHETLSCLDVAIVEFLKSTRGTDGASYQKNELQKFFEKYVFKKNISPEFALGIMKLKTVLVGGNDEVVTRVEFEKLRNVLKILEIEMNRLYPNLGLYFFRDSKVEGRSISKQKIDSAIIDLKLTVNNLFSKMYLANIEYSLIDFQLFLVELEKFTVTDSTSKSFWQWRENIPIFNKIKTLLVGEDVESRSQKEMNQVWDILIDAFHLGLDYQLGIHQSHWVTPEGYAELDGWIQRVFNVLERGLSLRAKGQIPFSQIDEMLDVFYEHQLWIDRLQLNTAKITYRQFISRFVDQNTMDLSAFDFHHLLKIQRDFKAFQFIQKIIGKVFELKRIRLKTEVLAVVGHINLNEELQKYSPLSRADQIYYAKIWAEFIYLLNDKVVRHWDDRGQFSVGINKMENWSYEELTRMNILRLPASVFMQTYGLNASLSIKEKALDASDISLIFIEFRKFGDELGFFDRRNIDSASSSTREADMFSPSGNGDGRIQFLELFDLFSVMWSGGLLGVADFKNQAAKEQCLLPQIDFFKNPYLEMKCAAETFHKNFSILFPNLPKFNRYLKTLDQNQWNNLYLDFMAISRICPQDLNGLETSDQRTMMVLVHYIENLFSVYDIDRNDSFDESEVVRAYPRFSSLITEVTKQRVAKASPLSYSALESIHYNWDNMALEVFKYIVFNGRTPTATELMRIMTGKFWGSQLNHKEANRQNIVKVFSTLKSEISSVPAECNVK